MKYFIGIDDTDNEESRGTGNMARRLARRLAYPCLGVTRHQFLIHPDIPFTSHNSGACMVLDVPEENISEVKDTAVDFLESESASGSDPGLCIAGEAQLGADVLRYARDAQNIVLEMETAIELAATAGISLTQHGGNGQGIIGALSSCALRASGDDGRFIDLNDARKLGETVTVADLLEQGIDEVVCSDGQTLAPETKVNTMGWVRPELKNGLIILKVAKNNGRGVGSYEVIISKRKKYNR